MRLIALSALLVSLVACSSSTTASGAPPSTSDAGADAATSDDDAATGTDASDASTSEAPTAVAVTLNGATRTLTRAQFGKNADGTLHIESHLGGDAACPTESSPSPMYTLIIDGVPSTTLTGSFLDFQGDILTGATPSTKATAIEVTNVQTTATSTVFDVTITFAEGTASGHVSADHCASLDE